MRFVKNLCTSRAPWSWIFLMCHSIFADLVDGLIDIKMAQMRYYWKACDAIFRKVLTLKILALDLINLEHVNTTPKLLFGLQSQFLSFVCTLRSCINFVFRAYQTKACVKTFPTTYRCENLATS